ncbi:Citrate-binding protein [Apostasia shenzhenica]|uniref:Citrate-binding protein n=1 Tax=Apostasia shenzhenica TaxID=1088818 RepID=A0A2I0A5M1_9ASPA|nr:Citrate-binding protein [Apostasia shenzhenica]
MGSPIASFGWFLLSFMACSSSLIVISLPCINADPTDGFTPVPLTDPNFKLQKPYNVPAGDCYSDVNGVLTLWVRSSDQAFKHGSPTLPRAEIRIKGYDYSSGVWQFEGDMFVPNGTTGATVMQIRRENGQLPATILMLMVYDGVLKFHSGTKDVESNIYDRWMRLNVIHDVGNNTLTIYVDGVQKLQAEGNGDGSVSTFYFKFGVYEQKEHSPLMESRWQNVKLYKK